MEDLSRAFSLAARLIVGGDAELFGIVGLSLRVSGAATLIAFVLGAPLGAALAVWRFPGRHAVVVAVHALLGLPPVVVGLLLYVALSRSGPLGAMGLLFTPAAMTAAQAVLALPIVVALTHRTVEGYWRDYGAALLVDGASLARACLELLSMARGALVTVLLAAFGRCVAEVGAILVVGGNIRGFTRTMTTAIALETSKGDLALALALGLTLISISAAVSAAAFGLQRVAEVR